MSDKRKDDAKDDGAPDFAALSPLSRAPRPVETEQSLRGFIARLKMMFARK